MFRASDNSMPLLPAPNPTDLVTRPIQPDDVQRIVAHIAFTGATRRHTFIFLGSPFSVHHPEQGHDIQILRLSFLSQFVQCDKRVLLEDISGEGGTDVSIEEGSGLRWRFSALRYHVKWKSVFWRNLSHRERAGRMIKCTQQLCYKNRCASVSFLRAFQQTHRQTLLNGRRPSNRQRLRL